MKPATPPIDLLLPRRDLRAFCRGLPEIGRRAPYVSILKPIEVTASSLRGVRGVYALAPFRCRTPAPGVTELLLGDDVDIDERTARCFSRVVNLGLHSNQVVPVGWFDNDDLRGLSFSESSIADARMLRTTRVRRLSFGWLEMPLDCLPPSVEWLSLVRIGPRPVSALEPLWELRSLEQLRLMFVELTSLTKLARLPSLVSLEVLSTRTFKGIARLEKLRSLRSERPVCPPIAELVESPSLRSLSLRSKVPPPDLAALGKATALESLTLDFGDIHGRADIKSFAFLRTMRSLRDLDIVGVKLTKRGVPVGRRPRRRALFTPRLIASRWTIFEDAAVPLGVEGNYAAERAVRRQMKAVAPELSARIEFDCEADSFCANAGSKKDLVRLATLMRAMAKQRPAARRRP